MSGLLSELFAPKTVTGPDPDIANRQRRLSVRDRQWTVVNQGWTHRQQEIYSLEHKQDDLAFEIMRSYLEYSPQSGPPELPEGDTVIYGLCELCLKSSGLDRRSVVVQL